MPDHRRLLAGTLAVAMLLSALPSAALGQSEAPSSPEASGSPEASISLEGVDWALTSIDAAPIPADVLVTLSLADGMAGGNAGCNAYFGAYELDGASLAFPDPFGATMMMCEEPASSVEATYLPLLSETASWSVDASNSLSLADADGVVRLTYSEMPVDITATDVATLGDILDDLQAQIDEARSDVTALTERAEDVNVNRFDQRVTALEESVEGISSRNLRRRIGTLEETVTQLDSTIGRLRERLIALETASAAQAERLTAQGERLDNQGRRITALEEASAGPTPEPNG